MDEIDKAFAGMPKSQPIIISINKEYFRKKFDDILDQFLGKNEDIVKLESKKWLLNRLMDCFDEEGE
jgi:hypothetical protein